MAPELGLFSTALGLGSPWQVVRVHFDPEAQELHLRLDFPQGSRFACPGCAASCSVYDSEPDRTWRHLNFFQHRTLLHARFPRVACKDCGVRTVQGAWARPGSGFTLLFEAFVLTLCRQMPVRAVARLVGEHDARLWTLLGHYVEQAQANQDMSRVRSVGVDETASRPGQEYVTLFADHDKARVVFVASGKGADTVRAFAHEVKEHGGQPGQVKEVSLDMSPAFESGVSAAFPQTTQVVDRFHVMQLVNDALDDVRRAEAKSDPKRRQALQRTRYLWLKNPPELTERQRRKLKALCSQDLQTARAYQCKLSLQQLWGLPDRKSAPAGPQERPGAPGARVPGEPQHPPHGRCRGDADRSGGADTELFHDGRADECVDGGDQQSGAGHQSPSARVSQRPLPEWDDLPPLRQAQLSVTHTKQRITL